MTPEEILSYSPRVLTEDQRKYYFDNGYLLVERVIPAKWIERLKMVTQQMVERSRTLKQSDAVFDLEPGHTNNNPRLRRMTSPVEHHNDYWEFASQSIIADIAADLVGPDVKFHHSKLNFKWGHGGEEVKWHQDIGFWPHTNFSPCTLGLYLYDCDDSQGPLGVIQNSHTGPLYDQYDDDGEWVGHLSNRDVASIDQRDMIYLPGPAGSGQGRGCRRHRADPLGQPDDCRQRDTVPYQPGGECRGRPRGGVPG